MAVAVAGDGAPFEVGLVWIVRDTKANRALLTRYEHIFEARFPGWSQGWVDALTKGAAVPDRPGLIWCDTGRAHLFARRRRQAA